MGPQTRSGHTCADACAANAKRVLVIGFCRREVHRLLPVQGVDRDYDSNRECIVLVVDARHMLTKERPLQNQPNKHDQAPDRIQNWIEV